MICRQLISESCSFVFLFAVFCLLPVIILMHSLPVSLCNLHIIRELNLHAIFWLISVCWLFSAERGASESVIQNQNESISVYMSASCRLTTSDVSPYCRTSYANGYICSLQKQISNKSKYRFTLYCVRFALSLNKAGCGSE